MDKTYQDVHIAVRNWDGKASITVIREVKLVSLTTVKDGFLKLTYVGKDDKIKHEMLIPRIEGLNVLID